LDQVSKKAVPNGKNLDWPVVIISGGFVMLFVLAALINIDLVTKLVNWSFSFSTKYFGAFWQVLLLLTFVIAIILAFSKYGGIRLGGLEKPEVKTFAWISMIMTALLAGGGVFWSAAEPITHFMNVPPAYQGVAAASKPCR